MTAGGPLGRDDLGGVQAAQERLLDAEHLGGLPGGERRVVRVVQRCPRQLFLGDTLNAEDIKADYDAGVLTVRIPVAEKAKPRKIAIGGGAERKEINA